MKQKQSGFSAFSWGNDRSDLFHCMGPPPTFRFSKKKRHSHYKHSVRHHTHSHSSKYGCLWSKKLKKLESEKRVERGKRQVQNNWIHLLNLNFILVEFFAKILNKKIALNFNLFCHLVWSWIILTNGDILNQRCKLQV